MTLRFCANLSYLFADLPLLDRFEAAATAGFEGVELLSPYEVPAKAIRERLDGAGLQQILINTDAGDRAGGERGMACIPGREREFRESLHRALDYAAALDCKLIHVMAGITPEGVPYDRAAALYAIHLAWAAELAQAAGVCLVIEAINHHDVPGYFLQTQEQAAAFIAAVGDDRVRLQFDLYHCQTAQGDVTRRLEALLPLVAHIQIADVPGRNEPGTGEIGWEFLFGRIEGLGYQGWIGCEYRPKGDTKTGLAWRRRYDV
jgi:hydroxypyruvate isomerase